MARIKFVDQVMLPNEKVFKLSTDSGGVSQGVVALDFNDKEQEFSITVGELVGAYSASWTTSYDEFVKIMKESNSRVLLSSDRLEVEIIAFNGKLIVKDYDHYRGASGRIYDAVNQDTLDEILTYLRTGYRTREVTIYYSYSDSKGTYINQTIHCELNIEDFFRQNGWPHVGVYFEHNGTVGNEKIREALIRKHPGATRVHIDSIKFEKEDENVKR